MTISWFLQKAKRISEEICSLAQRKLTVHIQIQITIREEFGQQTLSKLGIIMHRVVMKSYLQLEKSFFPRQELIGVYHKSIFENLMQITVFGGDLTEKVCLE